MHQSGFTDKNQSLAKHGYLRASGTLISADWYFVTDVSGQPVFPVIEGQAVKEDRLDL